ncbi:hypothetical protein BPAE_0030g00290 [Botrytis paeoniae]|uniref:Helicase ATP-binding domain-containing protein n=1 Tax=Botrytis paeoniae TaxID=278948 RepID=A0A4Z1G1S5_9HELO|nr:hypothetical protein BPAE_0030g00290 [Botrytis paeoniae]
MNNEREKGNGSVGQPKPSLVVGPIAVLNVRKKVVENFLSEKYQVHLYCAGEKTPILSRESLKSLKTPEYHIFVTNFEWLRAKHKGQNKPDLRAVFDTVIIDGAHTIKDENTGEYEVLRNLVPRNFILLTGTPVMNRDVDIAAMLSLFRPDSLWEDMHCDRKTNPFHLEDDHPFAVLRATSFAVHRYLDTLPEKDHVKRGEWLERIYDIVLLKQGFGTTMNGVSIGSAIPPVKTTIHHWFRYRRKGGQCDGGHFGRK